MSTDQEANQYLDDEELEIRERYRELLEEFRTIIPGVQVLFAFLLTAPFSQRFGELDQLGRRLFMTAMVSAGLAIVTLMAPASYHRVNRRSLREDRLQVAVRLAVVGMLLVGIAIVISVLVVARFVFGDTSGLVIASGLGGAVLVLWYALPLTRRMIRSGADTEN